MNLALLTTTTPTTTFTALLATILSDEINSTTNGASTSSPKSSSTNWTMISIGILFGYISLVIIAVALADKYNKTWTKITFHILLVPIYIAVGVPYGLWVLLWGGVLKPLGRGLKWVWGKWYNGYKWISSVVVRGWKRVVDWWTWLRGWRARWEIRKERRREAKVEAERVRVERERVRLEDKRKAAGPVALEAV